MKRKAAANNGRSGGGGVSDNALRTGPQTFGYFAIPLDWAPRSSSSFEPHGHKEAIIKEYVAVNGYESFSPCRLQRLFKDDDDDQAACTILLSILRALVLEEKAKVYPLLLAESGNEGKHHKRRKRPTTSSSSSSKHGLPRWEQCWDQVDDDNGLGSGSSSSSSYGGGGGRATTRDKMMNAFRNLVYDLYVRDEHLIAPTTSPDLLNSSSSQDVLRAARRQGHDEGKGSNEEGHYHLRRHVVEEASSTRQQRLPPIFTSDTSPFGPDNPAKNHHVLVLMALVNTDNGDDVTNPSKHTKPPYALDKESKTPRTSDTSDCSGALWRYVGHVFVWPDTFLPDTIKMIGVRTSIENLLCHDYKHIGYLLLASAMDFGLVRGFRFLEVESPLDPMKSLLDNLRSRNNFASRRLVVHAESSREDTDPVFNLAHLRSELATILPSLPIFVNVLDLVDPVRHAKEKKSLTPSSSPLTTSSSSSSSSSSSLSSLASPEFGSSSSSSSSSTSSSLLKGGGGVGAGSCLEPGQGLAERILRQWEARPEEVEANSRLLHNTFLDAYQLPPTKSTGTSSEEKGSWLVDASDVKRAQEFLRHSVQTNPWRWYAPKIESYTRFLYNRGILDQLLSGTT